MDGKMKHKKILITIGIVFSLIVIYSAIILISRAGKIATTIQYAPTAANITINGETVKNHSTKYLEPGDYQVTVSFEHFKTIETSFTISKDLHYIAGVLEADDEAGERYHNEHQNEFIEAEGVVSQYLNAVGLIEKQQHPILNYLPINNSLYSISYNFDTDNTTPIIVVKTTTLYLDTAVNKLKTLENVDLTAYQIVFKLDNPFAIYDSSIQKSDPVKTLKAIFEKNNYKLSEGQYLNDSYYAASFYIDDYERDYQYAHYHALLKRTTDEKWQLIASPQPLLTQYNTPNTPKEILDTVNSL